MDCQVRFLFDARKGMTEEMLNIRFSGGFYIVNILILLPSLSG